VLISEDEKFIIILENMRGSSLFWAAILFCLPSINKAKKSAIFFSVNEMPPALV